MSRTVLADVEGFTPVIDELVSELGLMSAVVFGQVWRYCQMEDHVCRASLEKLGERIGVDRVTVLRHIKVLCDHGYLEDLTPDVRNRPHVYADTGKAGLVISLAGVAESNTKENGVAQRNSGVAQRNRGVAQRNRGVAESHLKKVLKKEVKKEQETRTATPEQQIWDRVVEYLKGDMPRASFDSWVRDTKVIRYDRNTLTIGARNDYARDWLDDHLRKSAERLLVGIVGKAVIVEFVVMEKEAV